MLEGRHCPAFHSKESFRFKHKPTASISILCSVTVGRARQHVAFSHLLGIHCIPFTCCSCSVRDSSKRGQFPHHGPHLKVLSSVLHPSAPQHQDLDSPLSSTPPQALLPAVSSPGPEECGKPERPEVSLKGEVRNSHLLRFSPPLTMCCLQSSASTSLAFKWPLPPRPNRQLSPTGLRPTLVGTLSWESTLLFVLPHTSCRQGLPGKRRANAENLRRASWLQRTARRRWRRTTDGTHRNTVGAEELHVQFGDFLGGFSEPTSTVSASKSVFTKSYGN